MLGRSKMTLNETSTLNKQGSEFSRGLNPSSLEILSQTCPKFRGDVLCAYGNTSPTDYNDTYNHICMMENCDYVEVKEEFDLGMTEREEGPAPCPFCHREVE
jgi:hypothetical protein